MKITKYDDKKCKITKKKKEEFLRYEYKPINHCIAKDDMSIFRVCNAQVLTTYTFFGNMNCTGLGIVNETLINICYEEKIWDTYHVIYDWDCTPIEGKNFMLLLIYNSEVFF